MAAFFNVEQLKEFSIGKNVPASPAGNAKQHLVEKQDIPFLVENDKTVGELFDDFQNNIRECDGAPPR
jgi:hypothetical protein